MYKNVIVGVDHGPGGRDAVALATSLAAPDAVVTLVHVALPPRRKPRAGIEVAADHSLRAAFRPELAICAGDPQVCCVAGQSVSGGWAGLRLRPALT